MRQLSGVSQSGCQGVRAVISYVSISSAILADTLTLSPQRGCLQLNRTLSLPLLKSVSPNRWNSWNVSNRGGWHPDWHPDWHLINARIIRYLAFIRMTETKTVKFQVYLPKELRTRFKAKCVVSGTTMNEAAVKLIEAWTDKDELPGSEGVNNTSSDSQPQQSVSEDVPQRKAKRMSGKEFMQLGHDWVDTNPQSPLTSVEWLDVRDRSTDWAAVGVG